MIVSDENRGDIYTIIAALEDVSFHLKITVFGAQMDLSGKHHLDVSLFLTEQARRRCIRHA